MPFELPSKELVREALFASANATTKIVFLVIIGVIATANGVFNDQGVSDLGRLVYHVTLPSLLFVNIIREVTVERLQVLWKLPAMALVHVSTGFLLARLLTRFLGIRGVGKKAVTLCLMFGNAGALSIAVINTLCLDEPLKSGVGPLCAVRGVEYISFYLIAQNILMFTWAEEIVKDHSDEDEDDDGEGVAALPYLQGGWAVGQGEKSELLGEGGDVEEPVVEGDGVQAAESRGARPASQPQAIGEIRRSKGSYVRFHEDGGASTPDAALAPLSSSSSSAAPGRRSRVGSLDNGRAPPNPPSLVPGGSSSQGRLRRLNSQSTILDPEDINSILSRYPIDCRPSVDPDTNLARSPSSSYLPFGTSPYASGIFRRRSRVFPSATDLAASLSSPPPLSHPPPPPQPASRPAAGEGDYLLGGAGDKTAQQQQGAGPPPERRQPTGAAVSPPPTGAVAAAAAAAAAEALEAAARPNQEEEQLTCAERLYDSLFWYGDATWALVGRMSSNPSIRAAMVAFALGIVPPVKALFVGGDGEGARDPPLGAFLGAIEILGTAQVPCSMLMLSGSGTIRYLNDRAAKSPEVQQPFAFSPKTVFCIIAGRVLIFPVLGLLWWWAGFELGLFANVPVLSLVVLLDAAVPTAQNIVMLILVHGKPEHGHALAYVLLWQYALCVPMLIVMVTLFLAIIRSAYPI